MVHWPFFTVVWLLTRLRKICNSTTPDTGEGQRRCTACDLPAPRGAKLTALRRYRSTEFLRNASKLTEEASSKRAFSLLKDLINGRTLFLFRKDAGTCNLLFQRLHLRGHISHGYQIPRGVRKQSCQEPSSLQASNVNINYYGDKAK